MPEETRAHRLLVLVIGVIDHPFGPEGGVMDEAAVMVLDEAHVSLRAAPPGFRAVVHPVLEDRQAVDAIEFGAVHASPNSARSLEFRPQNAMGS